MCISVQVRLQAYVILLPLKPYEPRLCIETIYESVSLLSSLYHYKSQKWYIAFAFLPLNTKPAHFLCSLYEFRLVSHHLDPVPHLSSPLQILR